MQKTKFIFGLIMLMILRIQAQELNCKVYVNYSQLDVNTAGDKSVFAEMEKAIEIFMNNQRWTSDIYSEKEKIRCALNINLLRSRGQYSYSGNAQFTVTRPIYGVNYESTILSLVDRNFDFSFRPENRTMIFNEQSYSSNLTSMLAYYSLIGIGTDYDSFSKLGGSPYFERAFNLALLADQAKADNGWSLTGNSTDSRARAKYVENIRNQQFVPFRESFYTYHRKILDDFASNPVENRKTVIDYLTSIKTLATSFPNALVIRSFMDGKSQELIQIFSEGELQEKQSAFKLVSSLDPSKTESYRQILNR
ncbi:MAG: DUF4835 family protein [Leadbetterella sp.]